MTDFKTLPLQFESNTTQNVTKEAKLLHQSARVPVCVTLLTDVQEISRVKRRLRLCLASDNEFRAFPVRWRGGEPSWRLLLSRVDKVDCFCK